MSTETTARPKCRWCGRAVMEGDTADDPCPPDALQPAPLHVRCAAHVKVRMLDWQDSEQTPVGQAARVLEEIVQLVSDGQTVTVAPDSPVFARLRFVMLKAKGERP